MAKNNGINIKDRINTDPDFICSPRDQNNLNLLLGRYPNGCDETLICRVLKITKSELKQLLASAMEKMRNSLSKDIENS